MEIIGSKAATPARGAGPRLAAVILAGGSGTRFWPRSRKANAKQVLALHGDRTMIQQTLERLLPVVPAQDAWVITNGTLAERIAQQLPELSTEQIVSEPAARNTAPACALVAFLLEATEPDTVLGVFPSDHVVEDVERFAAVLRAGAALAAAGDNVVVLGVPPTRPETGYGYIEQGEAVEAIADIPVHRVRRFTEKPNRPCAEQFLAARTYRWNSGMFLWSVRTLTGAIREHQPKMAALLERIAAAYGTSEFESVLAEVYPQCEDISIDYAVLEPRSARGETESRIFCLPADFAWNDLGSWDALHEHLSQGSDSRTKQGNVFEQTDPLHVSLESSGNYVFAPGKMVALVGVRDLVVVETEDALLITTREHSQEVGAVVRTLAQAGRTDLI